MLHDAILDADGDLPVRGRHVTGIDLVLQRLPRRLGLHRGEWFAEPALGLPWAAWGRQRPPDVVGIGAAIRLAVEGTPGVVRVDSWVGVYVPETRTLAYTGTIRTADGDASASVTLGAGSVVPAVVLRVLAGAGILTR